MADGRAIPERAGVPDLYSTSYTGLWLGRFDANQSQSAHNDIVGYTDGSWKAR